MKNYLFLKNACILAVLAALGLLIAGYHPGAEDDEVYLSAIKRNLNPALFPHDSDFFGVQLQATVFDKVVAESVRLTHLPLAWVVLAWHYLAIYLVLLGCWRLSCRCFPEESAQWAATALMSVLLTLPIAGSALYIVDPERDAVVVAKVKLIQVSLKMGFTHMLVNSVNSTLED